VADWTAGLQVIDVSDPMAPALVVSLPIPSAAEGLALDGGYAYVAAADSGLQIVDITNPLLPAIVGWSTPRVTPRKSM